MRGPIASRLTPLSDLQKVVGHYATKNQVDQNRLCVVIRLLTEFLPATMRPLISLQPRLEYSEFSLTDTVFRRDQAVRQLIKDVRAETG